MSCRKSLILTLGLLGTAAGCGDRGQQLPVTKPLQQVTPVASSVPAPSNGPIEIEKEKEPKGPLRQPKATTCVSAGDFYAREAISPKRDANARKELKDHALQAYDQAVRIDPNNLPAYQGMARLHLATGNLDKALKTYAKALKVAPDSAPMWFEQGMCLLRAKKWEPALTSLARAVEQDPDNQQYVNTLGYALAHAERFDDSYVCFCRANDEATAHYKVARMARHLSKDQVTHEHLQLALQADPNLQSAKSMLAELQRPANGVEPVSHLPQASVPQQTAPRTPNRVSPVAPAAPPPQLLPAPVASIGENKQVPESGEPVVVPQLIPGIPEPAAAPEPAPLPPTIPGAGGTAEQQMTPLLPVPGAEESSISTKPVSQRTIDPTILPTPPVFPVKYEAPVATGAAVVE